jgi:hypothetical protein
MISMLNEPFDLYSEIDIEPLLDSSKDPLVVLAMPITEAEILSNRPAFPGRCRFSIDYWRISLKPVSSPVLTNPTWKEVLNACNDLLQTGDRMGVFLENVCFEDTKDGIDHYAFHIGS